MNNEEKEVIKKLLKLYPDVIEDLGGEAVVNSNSKIERIGSYITNHKWFINQNIPFTISMEDAFFSWYENVYTPQRFAMDESNINFILKRFSSYKLFKMVSDEYYYQIQNSEDGYYNKACYTVINRESKSFLFRKIAQAQLKKVS